MLSFCLQRGRIIMNVHKLQPKLLFICEKDEEVLLILAVSRNTHVYFQVLYVDTVLRGIKLWPLRSKITIFMHKYI